MDESPEKQELTELISHLTHEMFAINTDLTHSQHELTELRRQIYEPFVRAQLKDMRAAAKEPNKHYDPFIERKD
jgi:hypothetical protein